jgi:hypothetical protein
MCCLQVASHVIGDYGIGVVDRLGVTRRQRAHPGLGVDFKPHLCRSRFAPERVVVREKIAVARYELEFAFEEREGRGDVTVTPLRVGETVYVDLKDKHRFSIRPAARICRAS